MALAGKAPWTIYMVALLGQCVRAAAFTMVHHDVYQHNGSLTSARTQENVVQPLKKTAAEGLHMASGAGGALHRSTPIFGTPFFIHTSTYGCTRVSASDLDHDGLVDVLASCNGDGFMWYRNLGGGVFDHGTLFGGADEVANQILTADLDNDGLTDVLRTHGGKISWFKNLGSGAFAAESVIMNTGVARSSWRVFASDLDNDGLKDLLCTEYYAHDVFWMKNLGGGSFGTQSEITSGSRATNARSPHALDLDGDGYADAIIASTEGLAWYRNTGAGSFENARTFIATPIGLYNYPMTSVATADVDNDGITDILYSDYTNHQIGWIRNLGGASFSDRNVIDTSCLGAQVVLAVDMDLDGIVDVVAACGGDSNTGGPVWYQNDGSGNFASKSKPWTAYGVYSVAPADLDGDGDIDMAASSYQDPIGIRVSLNSAPPPPTPSPTPATPSETPSSASATGDPHLQNIYGERFDLMKAGNVTLIRIPRGLPVENALLTVEADARRLGAQCADIYFQSLNVTGAWADKVRAGGLTFTAGGLRDETLQIPGWTRFGPLQLKVVRGRTSQGTEYLNFYVKHLREAGAAVGGLLGEDDYTEAARPEAGCRKSMSLQKKATSNSDVAHTEAIASLA